MACSWIWLPKEAYPDNQTTIYDIYTGKPEENFTVAEFSKKYSFDRDIASVSVTFSGNSDVQLYCNDKLIATGPSSVGGDFLGNGKAREWYYSNEVGFFEDGRVLDLFARVRMNPIRMYEYSKGHGGFMLEATVNFKDGSKCSISTDETWLVRKNGAFVNSRYYDGRVAPDSYMNAQIVPDIWHATPAQIPVTSEKEIVLGELVLPPHGEVVQRYDLDKIYAGVVHLCSKGEGVAQVSVAASEINEESEPEVAVLQENDEYRGFYLQSVGNVTVKIKNESEKSVVVSVGVITVCYPVTVDANTETCDKELNEVLSVCKHTLKYCRQTHHLDSPKHCEPLACTGDYYIESLMTAFSFGDMRLAEFDVERTAQLLRHNDGRMFHTTYSLIWVRMMYDVYMLGGNFKMLEACRDALDMLLARFEGYVGENDLIENPPDYMFVDWIYIDEMSMHHPPKALGQTVLNMFYYMALDYAARIYTLLGNHPDAANCVEKKNRLQKAVNALLYDAEKGMYFEGLNTPDAPEQVHWAHPQNVDKRYYLKHSNIMAAYTSICDDETAGMLIDKIMTEQIEGNVQPYFQHYLLEAIYAHGLRNRYTIEVVDRWKPAVKECNKGLAEGFFAPEPSYVFDHSHAWGGTPLYSLPKALTGLSLEEPGFKKIKLNPSLLGLEYAKVEIPTPYGMICCELKRGHMPEISAPNEIFVINEAEVLE